MSNGQYDPYIPAGGAGARTGDSNAPGNPRTAAIQAVSIVFQLVGEDVVEVGLATPRIDGLRLAYDF
jgi:hypothetical protein